MVLVDWTMSEDEKNVCVQGGGGGQVSVVDGTVVLRASISFILIADSQTPPL